MINKIGNFLTSISLNFPLQLLILHIKKHQLMLVLWLILFASIFKSFGTHYGVPYLFLDPEYRNRVDFYSFLIVGFSLGGFIMAWQISFYMLNSYRFNFLASLTHPFVTFCLNNSTIPLLFIACYIFQIVRFDSIQGMEKGLILINIIGLLLGILIHIIATSIYFLFFNKDVNMFLKSIKEKTKEKLIQANINLDILPEKKTNNNQWMIETYLSSGFEWKLARDVSHYDPWVVKNILRSHHYNAFVVIIVSFASLFFFGSFIENPFFRIPAASSVCLLFTTTMVIMAGLSYFFGDWRFLFIIAFILSLNYFSQFNLFVYRSRVAGMDYQRPPLPYNQSTIEANVTRSKIMVDISDTKAILDKWKNNMLVKYGQKKPKLIFICTGGGGSKSAYWTNHVLQKTDKALSGALFDHCMVITGASGGMLGAAYYRELYLRKKQGKPIDLYDPKYTEDIGKDLLNAIMAAGASNDIFFPWKTHQVNGQQFRKDRAFAFDLHLNENTEGILNKRVMDYQEPEKNALIPLMLMSPVITNDHRTLFISPQSVSYLTKPFVLSSKGYLDYIGIDGIEFMSYFEDYNAEKLNFITALRMQASFPYLFPTVHMPTVPIMKIMDAGLKENYGLGVATRFYNVFKNWIDENTSGVIFMQIRTDWKFVELEKQENTDLISDMINPLGNIYANFMVEQEYNNDIALSMLENMSKTDISYLPFAYEPAKGEEEAAMSIHITERDKTNLRTAFQNDLNQESLNRLKKLLTR